MHAKERRWDGVVKIHKLMRERNINKENGVSVEIKGTAHFLVSEDYSHPDSRQIFEKLGELLTKIKQLGGMYPILLQYCTKWRMNRRKIIQAIVVRSWPWHTA
ncbi:LOW QUALITY PROTEIN: hypothetical protein PanWU01x14_116810 [Parasponia andersonii]|uniref:DYW domain containing protein n=1 Tax=Parasponia andersonii TaxID=3476 RepID=A0A2P5CWE7_PARAD|nr:LOW QUALITY PROTEIN: hypothetical protein PanWU01x14_116810 [Parasponia andersonii]